MIRQRPYLKKQEKHTAPSGQLMGALLTALKFDPTLYTVFDAWDKETKGLFKGCEAVAIQGSRLCVRVPSVMHRQEILYAKQRLLSKLNQVLGKRRITDIQFELKGKETTRV